MGRVRDRSEISRHLAAIRNEIVQPEAEHFTIASGVPEPEQYTYAGDLVTPIDASISGDRLVATPKLSPDLERRYPPPPPVPPYR